MIKDCKECIYYTKETVFNSTNNNLDSKAACIRYDVKLKITKACPSFKTRKEKDAEDRKEELGEINEAIEDWYPDSLIPFALCLITALIGGVLYFATAVNRDAAIDVLVSGLLLSSVTLVWLVFDLAKKKDLITKRNILEHERDKSESAADA